MNVTSKALGLQTLQPLDTSFLPHQPDNAILLLIYWAAFPTDRPLPLYSHPPPPVPYCLPMSIGQHYPTVECESWLDPSSSHHGESREGKGRGLYKGGRLYSQSFTCMVLPRPVAGHAFFSLLFKQIKSLIESKRANIC